MSKERQSKEKKKRQEWRGEKTKTENRDETKMEDEFRSRAASLETIS